MDQPGFVRSHTRLRTVAFIPEIKLHTADEVVPIWEASGLDAPPFWAFPWAGGQGLARYILDNPSLVRGRRVVDIASGSGLVAVVAALCGASSVLANEIDGYADSAIALNAEANGVAVERHFGPITPGSLTADVVLAGDVFYSRDMTAQMLTLLRSFGASTVLVGDPGRAYLPRESLIEVAAYDVPVIRDLEDADIKRTTIWQLRA